MTTNTRPQNRHTPYKLEVDGREYGCYAHHSKAMEIGKDAIAAGDATSYIVRDLHDNVVAEG